jgi:hypothetical protein
VTSKPFKGTTFSLPFTIWGICVRRQSDSKRAAHTIKTSDDRFPFISLFYNHLDVRIMPCEGYEIFGEVCAAIGGGWPCIAVLKDEFSYLRNEHNVSV